MSRLHAWHREHVGVVVLVQVLLFVATLAVALLATNKDVNHNSQRIAQQQVADRAQARAVIRACDTLNAAIMHSQAEQGGKPTQILIGAIFKAVPEAREPYLKAVKTSPPVLPTIDCRRVARDPKYRPFK